MNLSYKMTIVAIKSSAFSFERDMNSLFNTKTYPRHAGGLQNFVTQLQKKEKFIAVADEYYSTCREEVVLYFGGMLPRVRILQQSGYHVVAEIRCINVFLDDDFFNILNKDSDLLDSIEDLMEDILYIDPVSITLSRKINELYLRFPLPASSIDISAALQVLRVMDIIMKDRTRAPLSSSETADRLLNRIDKGEFNKNHSIYWFYESDDYGLDNENMLYLAAYLSKDRDTLIMESYPDVNGPATYVTQPNFFSESDWHEYLISIPPKDVRLYDSYCTEYYHIKQIVDKVKKERRIK